MQAACWHLDPDSASSAPCCRRCRRSSPVHACGTAFVREDVCATCKALAASGPRGDAGRNRRRWRVAAALTVVTAGARVRAFTQGWSAHLN